MWKMVRPTTRRASTIAAGALACTVAVGVAGSMPPALADPTSPLAPESSPSVQNDGRAAPDRGRYVPSVPPSVEPQHRGDRQREPVLFSTDMSMGLTTGARNGMSTSVPDIDDSYALALALAHGVDVRGVVVTMGNSMAESTVVTAQATVDALGADIPVVQGAEVWLPVEAQQTTGGADLTNTCVNDGVRFMADQLRETGGLTILAIGPLTDVACLTMNFPEEAALISRIVALAGSKPTTVFEIFGTPLVDFNYIMDPRAGQIVLDETTIPFTAITFDLSSLAPIPIPELERLATSTDPLARFYGESSMPRLEMLKDIDFGPAYPIFDAAAAWHLIRPQDQVCQQAGYRLKTGSPATAEAGETDIYDWFSPEITETRQVTSCTGFTSRQAAGRYQHAILQAVGGDGWTDRDVLLNEEGPLRTDEWSAPTDTGPLRTDEWSASTAGPLWTEDWAAPTDTGPLWTEDWTLPTEEGLLGTEEWALPTEEGTTWDEGGVVPE